MSVIIDRAFAHQLAEEWIGAWNSGGARREMRYPADTFTDKTIRHAAEVLPR